MEGTTDQAGLMREKRKRDTHVIQKHHLLKRLAEHRAPGEAVLSKEDSGFTMRVPPAMSAASRAVVDEGEAEQ